MARSGATTKPISEQEDISRSEKLGDEASSGQPDRSNAPSGQRGIRPPQSPSKVSSSRSQQSPKLVREQGWLTYWLASARTR